MRFDDDANPLISFGFTELEARIYTLLLGEFPITGYRIAKGLGKPAANTYKALESLERKGAVIAEEGEHRLFRPIPPADLLRQVDERYQRLRGRADSSLTQLHREAQDDRVYRLRSVDQVLERARGMVAGAREVLLLDAFPETVELLADPIRAAIGRSVLVGMQTYAPVDIAGAIVATSLNAESVRERWPGRWLNVVADGGQYMMALLTRDGQRVIQAVWTECPYLAWVHHSAFSSEIIVTALRARIAAGASNAELNSILDDHQGLKAHSAPGYRSIMEQLERDQPGNGRK